jgi:hypothetical protein
MKTIKLFLKPITYLLAFLILYQGCVIYKKKPSTIDEAVRANTNVRIETKDNQTIKFKRIEFKNGQYLGISKSLKTHKEINITSGLVEEKIKIENLQTPLQENNISEILIKSKTMSTVVPIAFVASTAIIIFMSTFSLFDDTLSFYD